MPRKIRCTVESISDHGGRVYTLDLKPESLVPAFRSGQFLHLAVEDYDPAGFWPESRVFSIASSPRQRQRLRICYSVKGRYTNRMEQILATGREVWVKLPYGDFVIDDASDAVLIAGGTGISAFIAFLEALSPQTPQKVTLLYGARTPKLFLFYELLLAQLAAVPNLNVVLFSETPDVGFVQRLAALPRSPRCFTGRISLDFLLRPSSFDPQPLSSALCPLSSALCPPSSVFYLSGPPVMLSVLGNELRAGGVVPERIRKDAWD